MSAIKQKPLDNGVEIDHYAPNRAPKVWPPAGRPIFGVFGLFALPPDGYVEE